MVRYATGFDVAAVFFTHLHLDHWLGVVGFMRTLAMQGRPEPLDLYGPRGLSRVVERYMAGPVEQLSFDLRVREVVPGERIRRDGCDLVPFATRHASLRSAGRSSRTRGQAGSTRSGRPRSGSRRGPSSARSSTARR